MNVRLFENSHTLALLILGLSLFLSQGCSISRLVANQSPAVIEIGMQAMYQEDDLQIAAAALPSNLKILDGLLQAAPDNIKLNTLAAQGYYGYSYGFVEDESRIRASRLYLRCRAYAAKALESDDAPLKIDQPVRQLKTDLEKMEIDSVPALFWLSSCWAKIIDMNRDNPALVAELPHTAAIMDRVLQLNEAYFWGGPHTFFGIYYASRPAMLGGNLEKAALHFNRAEDYASDKVMSNRLLKAQFLDRQQQDRQSFHQDLLKIIDTPLEGELAKMALVNRISQQKAVQLLTMESEWFLD